MYRMFRPALRILFLSSAVFLAACSDSPKNATPVSGESVPQLLPADTALGKPEERMTIRTKYDAAIEALRQNREDPGPYLKLAEAYIMQSRISGNSAYYQSAVLNVLDRLITSRNSTADQRFQASMYKSNMLFGMNRFWEALDAANEGLKLGDGNAGIWATVSDANLELGNYPEAKKAADRMMKLRPDLRSYARVAYLSELRGDMPAAVAAMAMAVESGVPGLEPTEWARVQLGDLCVNTGKLDSAKNLYEASLEFRPDYAPASEGLARLAILKRDYSTAIRFMEAASKSMDDPLYLAQLAQFYTLAGDGAKAAGTIQKALEYLKAEEARIPKEMQPKPNYAREYAIVYRAARNYPKALEFAKLDQQLRPENARANQLLAWTMHLTGASKQAVAIIEKVIATGWKNPALFQEAAGIYRAAGDAAKADSYLKAALQLGGVTDPVIEAGN